MGVRGLIVLLLALALPAVALAADTDPEQRFTPADKRKALGLVLKRGDFGPGWRQMPAIVESPTQIECAGTPDRSDLVLTGEAEGNFVSAPGLPLLFSVANVFKTRAQALAGWARSVKGPLARCTAQGIEQGFSGNGVKATVTRKGVLAFPRYSARSIAYSFSFDVTQVENGRTSTRPFRVHLIGIGQGRGDVMLMAMGPGNGVPLADLKAFARVTAQRLAAAKL